MFCTWRDSKPYEVVEPPDGQLANSFTIRASCVVTAVVFQQTIPILIQLQCSNISLNQTGLVLQPHLMKTGSEICHLHSSCFDVTTRIDISDNAVLSPPVVTFGFNLIQYQCWSPMAQYMTHKFGHQWHSV